MDYYNSTDLCLIRTLDRHGRDPNQLLQILIELQRELGAISKDLVERLADELVVPPVQVAGVIDFYHFLHHHTPGRFAVLFSDNVVDQMRGSRLLAERLATRLQVAIGRLRDDQRVSIGFTSCTGMSDQGPALLVNGWPIARLDQGRIDRIGWLIEADKPLSEWPPELFVVEENIHRRDLLLANEHGADAALKALLSLGAEDILHRLEQAGLRGRGGAGFPAARKWSLCRQAGVEIPNQRVVVCNADEGEPGTFKDRLLLQSYAERLLDGMTLCAGVIGADLGFIYLRGEYLYLLEPLQKQIQQRRDAGLLGENIGAKAGFHFDIQIHLGAGAYICGEESALIESLEGKVGTPRNRPPFPVTHGYLGRPTVVNNVETFIAAAMIASRGADWFRTQGTPQSSGTKLLSISGDCARPGIYEYPYGVSIQQVLEDAGAQATQAVQLAGAAGVMLPPTEFHRRITFEDLPTGGSLMIFDQSRDLLAVAKNFADFFVHESCGFCTPCRVGTTLMQKTLAKIQSGQASSSDTQILRQLGGLMRNTSHCGLGATAANATLDLLDRFDVVGPRLSSSGFEPAFDLDAALQEARQASGRDDPAAHL